MTRVSRRPVPANDTPGGRIVGARLAKRMEQRALAEESGYPAPRLCEVERGRQPVEFLKVGTLVRLCRVLDVSMDHVVTGRDGRIAGSASTPGGRIAAVRMGRQMEQQALAEEADVSVSWLNKIERGRHPVHSLKVGTLSRICRVLDVSMDHVVTGPKPRTEGGKL